MQPVVPLHLLLAMAAKVLCSAVFVSNRDETEAMRNSAFQALKHHQMDAVLRPLTEAHVDRAAQRNERPGGGHDACDALRHIVTAQPLNPASPCRSRSRAA